VTVILVFLIGSVKTGDGTKRDSEIPLANPALGLSFHVERSRVVRVPKSMFLTLVSQTQKDYRTCLKGYTNSKVYSGWPARSGTLAIPHL
jgi:hypothetical protein